MTKTPRQDIYASPTSSTFVPKLAEIPFCLGTPIAAVALVSSSPTSLVLHGQDPLSVATAGLMLSILIVDVTKTSKSKEVKFLRDHGRKRIRIDRQGMQILCNSWMAHWNVWQRFWWVCSEAVAMVDAIDTPIAQVWRRAPQANDAAHCWVPKIKLN